MQQCNNYRKYFPWKLQSRSWIDPHCTLGVWRTGLMAKVVQLVPLGRGCQAAMMEGLREGCPFILLGGDFKLQLSFWALAWSAVTTVSQLCLHLGKAHPFQGTTFRLPSCPILSPSHPHGPVWPSQGGVWSCFPSLGLILTPTCGLMVQHNSVPREVHDAQNCPSCRPACPTPHSEQWDRPGCQEGSPCRRLRYFQHPSPSDMLDHSAPLHWDRYAIASQRFLHLHETPFSFYSCWKCTYRDLFCNFM